MPPVLFPLMLSNTAGGAHSSCGHASKSSQGWIQGGAHGACPPSPPPPPPSIDCRAWPITHARPRSPSVSKQRRLTAWLNTREGEPPAKHGRQDTENNAEAVSDSSGTLDSTLTLSSSSDASALRSGGGTPPPLAANRPTPNALAPPLYFVLDPSLLLLLSVRHNNVISSNMSIKLHFPHTSVNFVHIHQV